MAALYIAYAAKLTGKSVCVVADDTDLFIPLLHVSINCNETLYFRQGTTSSRDSITYHNVTSLSSQLEEKICATLPAFHSVTGSDFTKPFFGRSKINSFKKLLSKPESNESMNTDHVDIEKVMYFALHVIYNRPNTDHVDIEEVMYFALHVIYNRPNTYHVDIEKVMHFVLHVIYNRPKREKSPRKIAMRCCMLEKAKKKKSLHLRNQCRQIKSP